MAFINEYIPPADLMKYEIEKINKRYLIGGTSSRTWTIDRERDIYLRKVAAGREDDLGRLMWTLYWKGTLIEVEVFVLRTLGGPGGPMSAHERVGRIDIPAHLASERHQILDDFRQGLVAYKDGGVFSTATSYTLTLDI